MSTGAGTPVGDSTSAGDPTSGDPTSVGPTSSPGPASSGDPSADGTTSPDPTHDDDDAETGPPPSGECDFEESFEVADGEPWPAPWEPVGGVAVGDVQGGRGRLVPIASGYSLARMFVPLDCVDAEATFSFEFTDGATQGVGFYVRQNGGHLDATTPPGQGYAAFAEAFRDPSGIGAWRQVDGHEQLIEALAPFDVQPGVVHRVRMRVTQLDATTTRIQAKIWRDGTTEPAAWTVERDDQTEVLQGVAGGIAVDAWSTLTEGQPFELYVDDIVVTAAD